MAKLKVYYAHPVWLYGTTLEKLDINRFTKLGFEIVNPNNPEVEKVYKDLKDKIGFEGAFREVFYPMILECDMLIYRCGIPYSDRISSGVMKEINFAYYNRITVLELPWDIDRKKMSAEETKNILKLHNERLKKSK